MSRILVSLSRTIMHIMQPLPAAVSHGSSLLAAAGVLVTRPVAAAPPPRRGSCRTRRRAVSRIECRGGGGGEKVTVADAVAVAIGQDVTMTATVTTKVAAGAGGFFSHMGVDGVRDDIADLLHKSILLELVSSELDPKTGEEKQTVSGYARLLRHDANEATYEATFTVPASFGPVGAVVVENEHRREMFLKDIVVAAGDDDAPATFDCNSWVHSKFDNPHKRAFFPLKSYLPSRTPKGVEWLRKSELAAVHGDGSGERKSFERVYDYDVYNDLGDPDSDPDTTRPVLGGKDHPYPRRCRTGRHRSKIEPSSEARSGSVYVPRDEVFSEVKGVTFSAKTLRSALHAVVPSIETALIDASMGFPHFMAIDSLFDDGIELPSQHGVGQYLNVIPRLIKVVEEVSNFVLRFETPAMSDRDKFAWFRDEEFGRQTLAGLNPLSIQLVTEFPIVSKLDQETYGSPESLITKELIEEQINGSMTAEQAVASKKLFMLDYHDLFLPYVNKVRELDGTTLYGSRTLFFLTKQGTLNPIAIELTRPKSPAKPQWRQVFTHRCDATGSWLWKLAKAHVLAHDSGYHQLVSHWLRTHCCVEPYIIAANRCLSRMHPIYRLLHPHFRYTMEINALAREYLVSGKGIIESTFSPGKYSMELSSAVYDKLWRFDMEALPADLIRRGMAYESDDDGELKLTIEDYPYANDGLLVWDSIKEWANDYVAHYYPTGDDVAGDEELQGWWTEVRTKGHADKKDEPWWLALDSQENLVHVLTTIMWVTSGHHAAVNFGQYHYAGYFPNRPTIVRENMPVEEGHGEEEMERFLAKPEETMLRMFPSQIQAAVVMTVLDILSSHSPDEEYMGEHPEPAWTAEPMVKAAFEKLSGRMKEIEGTVDQRNESEELRNRCGAGVVPYELLKPFSGPGVTGRGIPNSISI